MTRLARIASTLAALSIPSLAGAEALCMSEGDRVRVEDARNRIFNERPDRVDYEGAERGLRFAARDCPTDPEVNGLLGLALLGMQSYALAEEHLQRSEGYHDLHPTWWRENGPVVVARLTQLRQTLGSLMVTADTPEARVELPDGRAVALPMRLPVRVAAGRFTIRVTAPGRAPASIETDVQVGEVSNVSATLAPVEAPHTEAPRMETATPVERVMVPVMVPEERRESPWRIAGWITAAVGAVSLVSGATALTSLSARQPVNVYGIEESTDDARGAAWVFTALGAVLVGGGVATALLAHDHVEEPAPRVTASLGSSPRVSLEVPF